MNTNKHGGASKVLLIVVYLITVLFWIAFVASTKYTATYTGPYFDYLLKPFLVGMTILPILGGIFGLVNAQHWGSTRSVVGRSLLGLSAGLIAWGGGMVVWNYYLFFTDIAVPYPSLADAIFILSWPLWTYGIFQLSRATGVTFALRSLQGKIMLFIVPFVVGIISYYLVFNVARGGVIDWTSGTSKLIFDVFYPIGDIVIATITVLVYTLSRRFLGGVYKNAVLILLAGFMFNYLSDIIFSYTTTQGTYFNGHFVDFLFTTTMFVLSMAIAMFDQGKLEKE